MKVALMSFAHTHASSYARLLAARTDVEVLTSDPDAGERPAGESGGAALAAELGVAYVDSYDELLAWGPDAVVVCSENVRHRAHVEAAAAAGAAVLCEKPLATSVADAEAMEAACAAAGVPLMVAFPVRFSPVFVDLREQHAAGALGRIHALSGTNNGQVPAARAWFTDPALAGGGAVTDHTVHLADLADALLGGVPAVRVHATANRLLHPSLEVETAGIVTVTYADGTNLTIDCSWSRPASHSVWGGLTMSVVSDAGLVDVDPFAPRVSGWSETDATELWLGYGPNLDDLMLSAFLDAVRDGTRPQPGGRVGVRTTAIVEAAYRSLRECRAVDVETAGSMAVTAG
ncbi:Gfo/Idh/MocA family protein [Puerhibacterium puerhi]|uniref:Gfo/Idh/MocA family protein n=1 Tax=Puerhibacterium puerhi TaxID=2692623 RepID=UPI00135AF369|nr:Gfo/Idh/MocA family oxidoreductase [Puerhibacterium puerhi]